MGSHAKSNPPSTKPRHGTNPRWARLDAISVADLIIPEVVDRMYRDLAHFKPSRQPAQVTAEAKRAELTKADVDTILRRTRGASAEELQQIISREKEFSLTNTQRDQVAIDLTIVMAHRSRQANGPSDNPTDEFIAKVLGYSETPYGLIEREWVNAQLRAGSQAIQFCKYHRPPECRCWAAIRVILWQAIAHGEKTPEAWAALHIYDFLAEFEFAFGPKAGAIQATD